MTGNWITIIGLVTVAIGTGLTIFGSRIYSREDSAKIEKKINETYEKLQQAKESSPGNDKPPGQTAQIQRIEDDFTSWAQGFLQSKEAKKLDREKAGIDQRVLQREISNKWRPYIAAGVDSLRQTLEAYNKVSGDSVKVELPDIPSDFYSSPYAGNITFPGGGVWKLRVFCPEPARTSSPPCLAIDFPKTGETISTSAILIMFDEKTYTVLPTGSNIPARVDMSPAPLQEFHGKIKSIIQSLVEGQLLSAK